MENREVILDIVDILARFQTQDGVVHTVSGITFLVFAGETLGLVGESGSFKGSSNNREYISTIRS